MRISSFVFCFVSWGHLRRVTRRFWSVLQQMKKQQFHNWITNKPWALNTLYNRKRVRVLLFQVFFLDWVVCLVIGAWNGAEGVPTMSSGWCWGVGISQFSSVYEWKSGFRFTLHSNQCFVSQSAGFLFSRFIFTLRLPRGTCTTLQVTCW